MPLWNGPLDNAGNTKTGEGRRGALGTITGGGVPAGALLIGGVPLKINGLYLVIGQ